MIEMIAYETDDEWHALRAKDVTASTAGALFGVHEYTSRYKLWAEKSGLLAHEEKQEPTPAMRRGLDLEGNVIKYVRQNRKDLEVTRVEGIYYRDTGNRIGGTPDAFVRDANGRLGVLQIKTAGDAAFRQRWMDDGEIIVPTWIGIQTNIEAYLLGAEFALVGVMVLGGWTFETHIIDVPVVPSLVERAISLTAEFWEQVGDKTPPPIDFGEDAELIARINSRSVAGEVIDLSLNNRARDLMFRIESLKIDAKEIDGDLEAAKAELRHMMGTAEVALIPGFSVSNKAQTRKEYTVAASTFRVLRTRQLEEKK